jgi:Spy/CpxP family protein refolding chaperone
MNRRLLSRALMLAGVCIAYLLADSVAAQGGRGRRGMGRGFRAIHQVELATLPEVQAELKLTDDQKTAVADLADSFREERRALRGNGGGGGGGFSEEARQAQAKLNVDFASQLGEVLDDAQDARILGVFIQVNGSAALNDAAVVAALALSDDQQQQLGDVARDQRQAMFDAFRDMQDLSDEEQAAKRDELATARDAAMLVVLTDDQRTKLEALKGEALEVDVSSLQRGRGRFGGGRRGGNDNDNDDAAGSNRPSEEP